MKTVNVKPWGKDQGDFVVINAEDFDPKVHTLLDGSSDGAKKLSEGLKVEELKAELEKRGIAIPDGVTLKADLAALLDGSSD